MRYRKMYHANFKTLYQINIQIRIQIDLNLLRWKEKIDRLDRLNRLILKPEVDLNDRKEDRDILTNIQHTNCQLDK